MIFLNVGADDETVLGALLHDIGQFATSAEQKQMICDASALAELDPSAVEKSGDKQSISVGVTGHERIGGQYLRKLGFSDKVAQLVEAHVAVKRYLTGKDSTYYDGLSAASKLSLKYQVQFIVLLVQHELSKLIFCNRVDPLPLNKSRNLNKIHFLNSRCKYVNGMMLQKL